MTRHCLRCGADHTPEAWRALEHLSMQWIAGEDGERTMRLDWRRCTCGNALPIDLADPEMEAFKGDHRG
jgi:hypothetical protein